MVLSAPPSGTATPTGPAQGRAASCRCPRDCGSEPINTCQDQCAVSLHVMRFAFTRCGTIPKLGWCAHLRRGKAVAHVYHGPWVETRDDWFVEGAWTGPFERGELDNALFLVGSGGVVRSGSGRVLHADRHDRASVLHSRTGATSSCRTRWSSSSPWRAMSPTRGIRSTVTEVRGYGYRRDLPQAQDDPHQAWTARSVTRTLSGRGRR